VFSDAHKVWWHFNNSFVANFLENLPVNKFVNQLRFDEITAMSLVSPFLRDTVYMSLLLNVGLLVTQQTL